MNRIKAMLTAVISTFMSWLGILAIPVLLMVACNVIDYFTGCMAAPHREECLNSYKGIRGITKKVCMWLLVVVGAVVDAMIRFAVAYAGIDFTLPFLVATVVAVWIVCNEIISILENITDIGVELPPFLLPLVKNIKKQMEDKTGKE